MNPKERTKILEACHKDPTSGHMGTKKTLACITQRFIWPGVAKDVNHLVSNWSTLSSAISRCCHFFLCVWIHVDLSICALGWNLWCLSENWEEDEQGSSRASPSTRCLALASSGHRLYWAAYSIRTWLQIYSYREWLLHQVCAGFCHGIEKHATGVTNTLFKVWIRAKTGDM